MIKKKINLIKKPLVAYIAYAPFGLVKFKKFILSYLKYSSGEKHDLLICYKGFSDYKEIFKWKSIVPSKHIEFFEKNEKNDFDIGSYFRIAEKYKDRHILYISSHQTINCNKWLKIFKNHYKENSVICSSAVYTSISSQFLNFYYSQFTKFQQLRWGIKHWLNVKYFPNPHIRTVGFLIKAKDLLSLKIDKNKFIKKIETNYFESGRKGLSNQLLKRGFNLILVNSDNKSFRIRDWGKSKTFYLDNQEKIIFNDNQTYTYFKASQKKKIKMNKSVWG